MSNSVFPDLPGLDIKVARKPIFNTKVLDSPSGKEQRGRFQQTPRYQYGLSFNFLRADPPLAELQTLVDFFEAHYGRWDSFLLDDPYDGVQRRVRFVRDDLDARQFLHQVWEVKRLELISVK